VKFILFVEDHTEKKALPGFFKRWLDPKLRERVGIKVVRFEGCAELWRDGPQKAHLYLEGPGNQDIIAVISLLDLYGLDIYPYDIRTAQDRYTWAKVEMEIRVDHPKFHHFFCGPRNRGMVVERARDISSGCQERAIRLDRVAREHQL
jgi:hypothetical protein